MPKQLRAYETVKNKIRIPKPLYQENCLKGLEEPNPLIIPESVIKLNHEFLYEKQAYSRQPVAISKK